MIKVCKEVEILRIYIYYGVASLLAKMAQLVVSTNSFVYIYKGDIPSELLNSKSGDK